MPGTRSPAESRRESGFTYFDGGTLLVHFLRGRMKEQIYPLTLAESQILSKGPRILREILLGAKLGGVHKN